MTLDINVTDLAYITAYLYHSGFLFVDLARNEDGSQSVDQVKYELYRVKNLEDFSNVLNRYTFSVISPLLYTRLMLDLEDIAGKLCTGAIFRQLYELTVKCEAVFKNGYDRMHCSYKYKFGDTEVDLWDKNLLFEAAIRHKTDKEHSVDKVAADYQVIRVLTDETGTYGFNGIFYRIGYPKALLMLSNGSLFSLTAAKAAK